MKFIFVTIPLNEFVIFCHFEVKKLDDSPTVLAK